MSDEIDTRDRVIALERDVQYLTAEVKIMSNDLKVVTQLLQQAKGARWAILGLATLGGAFAAKITTWAPWLLSGK